jgi:disease resistance protein RPM1
MNRYLIVIDDIWDVPTWGLIRCALVDSDPASRIIITTRICEVAKKLGGVYNMKPLSDDNSKTLFYTRVFAGEGINLDDISDEVSNKILRKCGGVPLSIITIASLLVGKRREDWSKVYDSIGFGHKDNEAIGNMRKILAFSYYNLPPYLKTCLLHLSIFPEDHKIEKNSLIWKWIAEGFVLDREEIGLFEVGESYFNELINRSMIRWIEPSGKSKTRDGCGVHDMVLDLIRTLSAEANLVTVQDMEQCSTSYLPIRSIRIRRLAFHKRSIEHNPGTEIGQVRSFNAFNCSGGSMPPLLSFRVLRVLALENCNFSTGKCCLQNIGKLVQLRYLGLVDTSISDNLLPGEIGCLKFLQTLDVRGSGIKELPASVGELRKLMCLRATEGTRIMAEIGKLTSLEELEVLSVEKSPNFAMGLGQLTKMRVLEIHFDEMDGSTEKALMESLRNLRKIQSLQIWSNNNRIIDLGGLLEDWTPAPSDLRQLMLCGIHLPRRPSWIDPSFVPLLSYLSFTIQVVQAQDLEILGKLSSLSYLYIWSKGINFLSYAATRDEFQNLRHLDTNVEIMCGQQGALPMVQKLTCRASMGKYVAFVRSSMFFDSVVNNNNNNPAAAAAGAELPVTLPLDIGWPGYMPWLQSITYLLDYEDCSAQEWAHVETLLAHLKKIHPNHPPFRIRKYSNRNKGLTFSDAIDYIRAVEDIFKDNRTKYLEFLDLLGDYRADRSYIYSLL